MYLVLKEIVAYHTHYAKQIYNITYDNLMKCRVLLLLHRIVYSRQPLYLYQKIKFSRSSRGKKRK